MLGRHPWAIPAAIAGYALRGPIRAGAAAAGAGVDAIAGAAGIGAAPVAAGLVVGGFGAYGMGSEYMHRREEGQTGGQAAGGMLLDMVNPIGAGMADYRERRAHGQGALRAAAGATYDTLIPAPLRWGAEALGRRMSGEPSEAQQRQNEQEQAGALRQRGYISPRDWAIQHGYSEKQYDESGIRSDDWKRYVAERESAGRPTGSIRTEMAQQAAPARPDPVVQQLHDSRAALERTLRELPTWIKQGQVEAARQHEQQLKLDVSGQVTPSPEFALKMQYQVSLDLLRSVQVAVS
jgi:hypothetical protein